MNFNLLSNISDDTMIGKETAFTATVVITIFNVMKNVHVAPTLI